MFKIRDSDKFREFKHGGVNRVDTPHPTNTAPEESPTEEPSATESPSPTGSETPTDTPTPTPTDDGGQPTLPQGTPPPPPTQDPTGGLGPGPGHTSPPSTPHYTPTPRPGQTSTATPMIVNLVSVQFVTDHQTCYGNAGVNLLRHGSSFGDDGLPYMTSGMPEWESSNPDNGFPISHNCGETTGTMGVLVVAPHDI